MICRLTPGLRLAAPRLRLAAPRLRLAAPRRNCSTAARTDGFTEALPRGDWVAPLVFGGAVRRASALPPALRGPAARRRLPRGTARLSACNSRGAGVVYVIGLAIHAHMLFEVYKLRRDIIKGTNVRGV